MDTQADFITEVLLSPMSLNGKTIFQAVVRDISERKQSELRAKQRKEVMEQLILGKKLTTILEAIAHSTEQESPGALCSILLLDDRKKYLNIGAAPSLPDFYNKAISGIEITENTIGLGSPAYCQQRLIIENIQQHPDWAAYKALTTKANLNSCWSEPIFGSHKKLLGIFCTYHHQSIKPTAEDIERIEYASRLSAIAIERSRTEAQQQLAASVFANSYEGIMITNPENQIVDVNPAFSRITGFTRDEMIGQSPNLLKSGRQDQSYYSEMWNSLKNEGFWRGEIWNRRKTGELYAEILAIAIVYDESRQIRNYVAVFSDISQIKVHEEELDRIAYYDPLTNLPNRRLLSDRLNQSISQAQRYKKLLAVCFLDLDGFKPINDTYGHSAGDKLLVEISNRLQTTLRNGDTLSRLGGDEFVFLMSNFESPQECVLVLKRALSVISAPVMINDFSVTVSASIGVALYPLDNVDGDTLLRHADHAMYRAKQEGKNCYHIFDPKQDQEIKDRQDYLQHLLDALHDNEFVLYYQPKVDLLNGELIGAEALIRWQHPEQGLLPPAAFLDKFNDTFREIELGEWVIQTALKQLENWQNKGLNLIVSVNISANHLLQANFTERLNALLNQYPSIKPHYLELEVLETAALDDMNQAVEVMTQCKALGVHFALDDFGTGYSSLSYFRRLPVDSLKIDQGFVRDMLVDSEDLTIVESVIRLAEAFNRAVIAEGVETLAHAERLVQLGCTFGQGYGIARPMPADKLIGWLAEWNEQSVWQQFIVNNTGFEELPLQVAIQSHKLWIEQLRCYLDQVEGENEPPLNSLHCAFGHWCRGSGFRDYGAWLELKEVIVLHERIHQFADELLSLKISGQQQTVMELQPELWALSDQLLVVIEDLAVKVATERIARVVSKPS